MVAIGKDSWRLWGPCRDFLEEVFFEWGFEGCVGVCHCVVHTAQQKEHQTGSGGLGFTHLPCLPPVTLGNSLSRTVSTSIKQGGWLSLPVKGSSG